MAEDADDGFKGEGHDDALTQMDDVALCRETLEFRLSMARQYGSL